MDYLCVFKNYGDQNEKNIYIVVDLILVRGAIILSNVTNFSKRSYYFVKCKRVYNLSWMILIYHSILDHEKKVY